VLEALRAENSTHWDAFQTFKLFNRFAPFKTLRLTPVPDVPGRVKLFGFCLMPNHFHFVMEPAHENALSQFMQWLLTSHVRRYHKHYGSSGHIWQGRFKSFPVQRDEHLIMVLRYVLQNPVRAGLSGTAPEWRWSSLRRPQLIDACPVDDEAQLAELVQED
jgi:putative transposase